MTALDITLRGSWSYCIPSLTRVACAVSLENVAGDVCELERGMEGVRREADARDSLRAASPHVLRDFLANAADKLRRLRAETKHAQVYTLCLQFGEIGLDVGPKWSDLSPTKIFARYGQFVLVIIT